jgi:hypothetical protein
MSSIHKRTVVLPGGQVVLSVPELAAGEMLDVTLTTIQPTIERRQAFLQHLKSLPVSRSAEEWREYEREMQAERDAWER